MALNAESKPAERLPVRLSIELSAAAYRAVLQLLANGKTAATVEDLLEALEDQLDDVLLQALKDVTGTDPAGNTFAQEIELRIVQSSAIVEADDDDEPDPVEGFRQAWHDAMTGNVHPISELWAALDAEGSDETNG